MTAIRTSLDVTDKLSILSQDSRYDLACACGTKDSERRRRSEDGRWIYPVVLPSGGKTVLFKTLVSNVCVNDCKYCPLRTARDPKRCTLTPDDVVKAFLACYRTGQVQGLFLSSGVTGTPDRTMDRLNRIARVLRRRRFDGFIHLKVIPGASDAAIEDAVSVASAVSINIETPGERAFGKVCTTKNYLEDIIRPLKLISRLTAKGACRSRVKQTTQFVVGASDETDRDIVRYSWGLYKRLGLSRVYFSAYQRGLGADDLPGEGSDHTSADMLTREHRLYQVDWLLRKYGFQADEIPFGADGDLSLSADPKELWASSHPEAFPIDVNRADKWQLLRVPGLGPVTVGRILDGRRSSRLRSLADLGKVGKRLGKAAAFVTFGS